MLFSELGSDDRALPGEVLQDEAPPPAPPARGTGVWKSVSRSTCATQNKPMPLKASSPTVMSLKSAGSNWLQLVAASFALGKMASDRMEQPGAPRRALSRTAFTVVPSSKGFVGVPRTEAPCRMRTRTSGIAGDSQIARSQEPLRQDRKKQARLIFNQTPSSVPYPVWCSNSDIKNRSGGDGRNPKSADSDARYCRNCRNIASANCAAPSFTMNRVERKCADDIQFRAYGPIG